MVGALSAASLGAFAGPAAGAAGAAAAPTGGAQPGVIPQVRSLECARNCEGHSGVQSSTRAVRAHAGSVLRLRGERLQTVAKVVFAGRSGSADDVTVAPRSVRGTRVVAVVPERAVGGPVLVTTTDGSTSRPGPKVRIHRHSQPAPAPAPPAETPAPPAPPASPPPSTETPSSAGLIWPVRGQITGTFGEDRGSHAHSGLDIAAPGGTPIKAAAAGVVIHQGWYGGYGNHTCVAHVTITTCYAHQSRYAPGTGQGAKVSQGQVIGYVGTTGNSSGNHLHFEVRRGLVMGSPTADPLRYLP